MAGADPSDGWIAVSRRLLDPSHDLFGDDQPLCKLAAWIDYIGLAEWRTDADLDRGCVQHATEFLRRRWNWPSKRKVHAFLKRLERDDRIEKVSDGEHYHDPPIYAIVNYDQYQFQPSATSRYPERPTERPAERPTERQNTGGSGIDSTERNDHRNDQRNDQRNQYEQGKEQEEQGRLNMGAADRLPHPDDLPRDSRGHRQYPSEYEITWDAYPERRGSNSKLGGYRTWRRTVINKGVSPSILHEAVIMYRRHCEEEGNIGTPYVKQTKTFFGPDEHWSQPWGDQPTADSEANRKLRNKYERRVAKARRATN